MKNLSMNILFLFTFTLSAYAAPLSDNLNLLKLDEDNLQYIFGKASRLSGITKFTLKDMPPIFVVPEETITELVCNGDHYECKNLAAIFDDIKYRILIKDSFDLSDNFDPFGYSFLIHELIHALQYLDRGPEIFKNCDAVFETESEAYHAQDKFLKEEGNFFRAAMALKYFYCDEEIAKKEYAKSLKVWQERMSKK